MELVRQLRLRGEVGGFLAPTKPKLDLPHGQRSGAGNQAESLHGSERGGGGGGRGEEAEKEVMWGEGRAGEGGEEAEKEVMWGRGGGERSYVGGGRGGGVEEEEHGKGIVEDKQD